MKEPVMIDTFRYVVNGEQVCAENFTDGEICEFFRTRNFGVVETCLFAPHDQTLDRHGSDKLGFLIPGDWCPLKEKKE